MASTTKIEWTDASWTPVRARRKDTGKVGWHCERVSPACTHCYAAAHNRRALPGCGTGLDYVRSSRDQVDIFIDELTLLQPLKWKRPRKVFVCSMTDLFAEFVPFEMVDRVFAVMALCPQHTFQVLTKRPERMAEYLNDWHPDWDRAFPDDADIDIGGTHLTSKRDITDEYATVAKDWPLPNVWLGTTVENQEWADKRILWLLKCPAAVRFLSVEPMLGQIYLRSGQVWCRDCETDRGDVYDRTPEPCDGKCPRIHWVICGGESGRNARPMHPDWARSLRDQCAAYGVPFFFKQWGEFFPATIVDDSRMAGGRAYDSPRGGRSSTMMRTSKRDWQQMKPGDETRGSTMLDHDTMAVKVGKKAAGRLLDGVEHSEFPSASTAAGV